MKYFLDTEFHEYKKKPLFGKPIDTIELISIGIVSEEGREYYAICKEFDLKAAWNSWQPKIYTNEELKLVKSKARRKGFGIAGMLYEYYEGSYWLRENVLEAIFLELINKDVHNEPYYYKKSSGLYFNDVKYIEFNFNNLKKLINKYGKTKTQIAKEIKEFVLTGIGIKAILNSEIEFHAYYADYDWVVFCWLFGRLIDLPKGFPMYCNDLKQELDRKYSNGYYTQPSESFNKNIENHPKYPKQTNEHNALADAKWNQQLYKFLNMVSC